MLHGEVDQLLLILWELCARAELLAQLGLEHRHRELGGRDDGGAAVRRARRGERRVSRLGRLGRLGRLSHWVEGGSADSGAGPVPRDRRSSLMSCGGAPARSMVLLCQPAQRLGRNSSSACSGKEAGEGRRRVGRLPAAARPWLISTSGSKGRWRGWVCRVDLAAMHCPGIGDGDLGITFRRETLARDRAEERRIVGRICGRA